MGEETGSYIARISQRTRRECELDSLISHSGPSPITRHGISFLNVRFEEREIFIIVERSMKPGMADHVWKRRCEKDFINTIVLE